MIDDEANFDDILDASEEVQAAAKFRPKQRVKPQKATRSAKSAASNHPTIETKDGKVGALTEVNSSTKLTDQQRAALKCPGSETVDGMTMSEDGMTVPLRTLGAASSIDRISQDEEHTDDLSKLVSDQENWGVSPASSCGKTIDDMFGFEETFDAQAKEERVAKFQPKVQAKLRKSAIKSQKTNQKVGSSTAQNEMGGSIQTKLHDDQVQAPTDYDGLLAPDSSSVGNLTELDSVLEESVQQEPIVKFRPKLQSKPGKASSRIPVTDDAAAALMVGVCADNDEMHRKSKDQETVTSPTNWSPEDVHDAVGLHYHYEELISTIDGTQSMIGEVSDEPTFKTQPNVGREQGKEKSVSFDLPDASGVVTPTDNNAEMGNFIDSCKEKMTDENLSNSSQQAAEKHSINEEQYSNDLDNTDNECQYHKGKQQLESNGGEIGSSMKLRSRKKSQKVGTPDPADGLFDEEDNDSGDDYTAIAKRKVRKKSRDGVEEPQEKKVLKAKTQASSRGCKRASKNSLAEKPEKKLTHRIRQRRTEEVKTLLETPRDQINPMKLSAAHLRLLQESRERVTAKEIPPAPSSNTSFQLEDMDDMDYGDEEARNFDNDRTENRVQNVRKLNYHSYMNKQTRAKWSKSDTDLFYQGLRQFGSDFAMIQQLFPDKTRQQMRQKFKSEEKKNPLQVNDAILHRSGDNLYFKKVIKQLNIDDVLPEIKNTHKQDGVSNEGHPGNENELDDFIEENGSDWLDKDHDVHISDVQEEHVSGNDDDDDLGDIFDWY